MHLARTIKGRKKWNRQHATILTPTHPNIASMLTVWHNPSPHTQTPIQKQPKSKKQTNPKPQVWCVISRQEHPHKDKNKLITVGSRRVNKE
jgi:hypothetical protein